MIISQSRVIRTNNLRHFSWAGLSRFKNIAFTASAINRYQSPPINQRRNVEKQATQIRQCIIQAEEYFYAARSVGLATRPLLMYYGTLSLALAELLIKQTGNSSLDRARGEHAHHGLTLKILADPSYKETIEDSASQLRATPLIKTGKDRSGTFELWHRSSRELPMLGETDIRYPDGTAVKTQGLVALGEDERPLLVPDDGISLLDCLKNIPNMESTLNAYGSDTELVLGGISTTQDYNLGRFIQKTYIHPTKPVLLNDVYDKFSYPPGVVDCVDVIQSRAGGAIVSVDLPFNCGSYNSKAPFGHQITKDEIFFSSKNRSLNEFGLFYFSLYILGNYARYYPDMWMRDVDSSSALSLVVSELLVHAEERIPILALSELSQTYFVIS